MGDVLVVCAALSTVAGAGVLVASRIGGGGEAGIEEVAPADPTRAAVQAELRELIASGEGVLDPAAGEGDQLALWATDDRNPGVVDADELVVLRFNRTLGALAAYTRPPAEESVGVPPGNVDAALLDRWRTGPRTERRVVGVGLASVRFIRTNRTPDPGSVVVRLVWRPEYVDQAPDEGAFEVRLPTVRPRRESNGR